MQTRQPPPTPDFATAAAQVRAAHPKAPALAILDLALSRHGIGFIDVEAPWLQPESPFGQWVAKAFDTTGATPSEWRRWTAPGADAALRVAALGIWREDVLPLFVKRYGCRGGLDPS